MKTFLTLRFGRFVESGLLALAAGVFLAPGAAHATPYVVDLVQFSDQGYANYVQAYASGAFDLSGLTFLYDSGPCLSCPPLPDVMRPSYGVLTTGSISPSASVASYTGPSGPTGFGSGGGKVSMFSTGEFVGFDASLNGPPSLYLPQGYVSGTELDGEAAWDGTFASLGVKPGTYVWTWGSDPEQSFTIVTMGSVTSVPEPAVLGMFGFGVLLAGTFVRLRRRIA